MTDLSQDSLWTSLPVAALWLDPGFHILGVNPAGENFCNQSSRALLGLPVWDVLAVDAPLETNLERVVHNGTPLLVNDVDIGTGARQPVLCSLQIAPVAGRSGELIMLITPRELAGRSRAGGQVASAARSAIGMAQMLAHEIKNPLAGITGAAQLLAMSLEGEDRDLTGLIVEETHRIVTLLERVEQFGNLVPPRLAPVNLHDVLDQARRSASVGVAAHMRFEEAFDPSLPLALADADQLLQVLANLIRNAAEAAGPDGGTITLRTFYEHSYRMRRSDGARHALPLQIEICDDGPGISEDLMPEIFDAFVSGRENGSGLGLALAARIVTAHEGWITVNSVPGQTVFRLSLPVARDEAGV